MTATSERVRGYAGPAILSYGFRPFFLLGALWAALVIAIWLPLLAGSLELPTAFSPLQWHVHELVYGYVAAVVAGFLLTAVPNWTGRLPVAGAPLLALVALWAAGRVAILVSARIGMASAAAIDLMFLATLIGVIAREIVAGKNLHNLKVLLLVGLLFVGNAVFHAEAMLAHGGSYGMRIGIGAVVLLIILIGGRIVPSFTRNWLARERPGRLPAPFGPFDAVSIAVAAAAIASWIALPEAAVPTSILAGVAGLLHALRLGPWIGYRTAGEPLVLVLHVAYAFVPVGFLLLALSIAAPGVVVPSGALHAWTVGAIGTMTLAVMTRASLGHTGRALIASPSTQLIYAEIVIAASARILSAFDIWREASLTISATTWVLAFASFAASFGPLLVTPTRR